MRWLAIGTHFVCFAWSLQAGETPPFSFLSNEEILYEKQFDSSDGWSMESMKVHQGELVGEAGQAWQQAGHRFSQPLALTEEPLAFYISWRTDASKGPEPSKLYFKLNLEHDPVRYREFPSFTFNVRPGNRYFLYMDPGWQKPHVGERHFYPKRPQFETIHSRESFRVTLSRISDTVLAQAYHWDAAIEAWVSFEASNAPVVLEASIHEIGGFESIKSIAMQMRKAIPAINAVAVTRIRK